MIESTPPPPSAYRHRGDSRCFNHVSYISVILSGEETIISIFPFLSSVPILYVGVRFYLGNPNQIAKMTNTTPIKIAATFQNLVFLFLIREKPSAIKKTPIIADSTIAKNPFLHPPFKMNYLFMSISYF